VCAGRLDMIIKSELIKGIGIGDVKRTSNIHFEHLKLQLNLYRLGYMQSYNQTIQYLKCFHLRKFVYELIDIPIDEEYARQAIENYFTLTIK